MNDKNFRNTSSPTTEHCYVHRALIPTGETTCLWFLSHQDFINITIITERQLNNFSQQSAPTHQMYQDTKNRTQFGNYSLTWYRLADDVILQIHTHEPTNTISVNHHTWIQWLFQKKLDIGYFILWKPLLITNIGLILVSFKYYSLFFETYFWSLLS